MNEQTWENSVVRSLRALEDMYELQAIEEARQTLELAQPRLGSRA